jgi:hypothetical protein
MKAKVRKLKKAQLGGLEVRKLGGWEFGSVRLISGKG